MIFEDLFYVLPTNIEIQVVGLEEASEGAETTQRCYSSGKLTKIEQDMIRVNVGKYKLRDADVLQVEPVTGDCLQVTVLDK